MVCCCLLSGGRTDTDKHTDIATYRLNRPMSQFSENCKKKTIHSFCDRDIFISIIGIVQAVGNVASLSLGGLAP